MNGIMASTATDAAACHRVKSPAAGWRLRTIVMRHNESLPAGHHTRRLYNMWFILNFLGNIHIFHHYFIDGRGKALYYLY
jgi:hypothetical protein